MTKIDIWLAKYVFCPPVVWLCQRLSINQFEFSNFAWMGFSIAGIVRLLLEKFYWGTPFILLFMVTLLLLQIHARGQRATASGRRRAVIWAMTPLYLFDGNPLSVLQVALVLFGEYALLINHIPPRKTKRDRSFTTA